MIILQIISGGQTGADRGGLDAAIGAGFRIGGYCPLGRRAEDGTIPVKYNELHEVTSADYSVRTEANVKLADVTLVFTSGKPQGGSKKTIQMAKEFGKNYKHFDLLWTNEVIIPKVSEVINNTYNKIRHPVIVNIAGSRESKSPGIHRRVTEIMVQVLEGF